MIKLTSCPNSKANVVTVGSLVIKQFNSLSGEMMVHPLIVIFCKMPGHLKANCLQLQRRSENGQSNPGATRQGIEESSADVAFTSMSESSDFSDSIWIGPVERHATTVTLMKYCLIQRLFQRR